MTFDEIVNDVMDRLNLTSTEARTRIGTRVNDRYKRVTSAIGLNTSRRLTKDITTAATTEGLPDIVVDDIEKVVRVTRTVDEGVTVLPQVSFDELANMPNFDGTPTAWAVKRMGPGQVIIRVDGFPSTGTFTLSIEGYEIAPTLADNQEPYFPSDFHDILIEGAMSDELRKMEKPALAQIAEANYAQRLSDLKMFIAKASYQDIYQGKTKPSALWMRPWASRTTIYN